jgi:hypothetical protein
MYVLDAGIQDILSLNFRNLFVMVDGKEDVTLPRRRSDGNK